MKRTIGAALTALAASAAVSIAAAQSQDSRVDVAQRDVETDYRMPPAIPSGTDIPVTLDENIPVTRDHIGDTFQGHITRDVKVDGRVALVADTPVEVKLVEQSGGPKSATLRLVKVNVNGDMRRVQADVAKADTDERGMGTGKKTGVGAAAGAIVGAVTGVGVLKGAIVGAGGGLAWGLLDGNQAREVKDDTPLRFSLEQDLNID
jgi:HAMP domain-containing protein